MILGVGIDITEISRMEKTMRNEAFMEHVFTEKEREYIASKNGAAQTAAGIFCAKEACMKAFGKGIGDIAFQDMEVDHKQSGEPFMHCSLRGKIHLSISHTGDMAIAQVVVESEDLV